MVAYNNKSLIELVLNHFVLSIDKHHNIEVFENKYSDRKQKKLYNNKELAKYQIAFSKTARKASLM